MSKSNFLYIFLLILIEYRHCLQLTEGWEYLNLHCRDNGNDPVDWWYIYKPPSNTGPLLNDGTNFSFITPQTVGRWTPSHRHIFSNSMLRYTLAPMFNPEYANYMGIVVFEGQEPTGVFKGSASLGLMMANEMGGVWISHTVPGFPDLSKDGPSFPPEEFENGHIIQCMTMDIATLNTMALALKQTEPNILKLFIPEKMKRFLPNWVQLLAPESDSEKLSSTSVKKTKALHFVTRHKTLRGLILARSPGDSRCIYMSFAKAKGVVMDVYGHHEHRDVVCDKKFSLRNINSISLKYPEHVYYINNQSDSMGFAISTAASWQRTGQSKNQYWTCTGNIENQPLIAQGGIIACVANYNLWLTFDNLKIKEPDC